MDGPSSSSTSLLLKGRKHPSKAKEGAGESNDSSEGEGEDEEDAEARMERMMKSFEHLGTELPPRMFEGGMSPLMPERKKGKIPGSAMDKVSFFGGTRRLFELRG